MAQKHTFLNAEFSGQWKESYQKLQIQQKNGADKVVIALLKRMPTPGMRVKPIEPSKYYYEAQCTDGDRVIHRTNGDVVYFVDIVPHDHISRYGHKAR